MRRSAISQTFTLLLLCLALLGAGCASIQNRASVNTSSKAAELFLSGVAAPGYTYYFYGRTSDPIAMLALDTDFTINSQFWTPVEVTDSLPEHWSRTFNKGMTPTRSPYKGIEIIAPDSTSIGLVYSRYYRVTAWFEDPASNVVTIPPPELATMQPEISKQYNNNRNGEGN